jgi:hypothetical protein
MASSDGPTATASLDYERSPADVRAIFFDVDLAVRDRIHRGVTLQRLAPTAAGAASEAGGGERRLRQTQRVLDRLQTEELVIEEGPGGTWVKRLVAGPNAGTRFVGTFEERGPGKTRVRIDAFVGPQGFAQGLGKLSPLGLEKAMKRLLGEFKRALEGYEPGSTRGEVNAVIGGWGELTAPMRALDAASRKKVIAALMETAWSIAASDEDVDAAEREAMQAVVASLWQATLDPEKEERMARAAIDAVAKEGAATRCAVLGGRLKALGFAELGVSLAVLVAEASHGLAPAELEGLQQLAAAAGVEGARLLDVIRRTEEALYGGAVPPEVAPRVDPGRGQVSAATPAPSGPPAPSPRVEPPPRVAPSAGQTTPHHQARQASPRAQPSPVQTSRPLSSRVARPLASLYAGAFTYPLRPVTLLWTAAVILVTSFVQYVPVVGGLLAGGITVGYLFAVLRASANGADQVTLEAGDVGFVAGWAAPLVRLTLACAVAFGPALIALAALGLPDGAVVIYGLGALGLLYLPAAIIAAAMAEGFLAGASPLPPVALIARIPGPYALTLVFLSLAAIAGGVALKLGDVVDVPFVGELVRRVLGLYSALVMARVLGLLVCEQREAL